jgi:hypothetical protein
MNWKTLDKQIESSRPKMHFSSLPFLVFKQKEISTHWFYYIINDSEEGWSVKVINLYTARGYDRVEIKLNPNLFIQPSTFKLNDPILSKSDYLHNLEDLEIDFDEDVMMTLIEQTEPYPIVEVYKAVIEYLKQTH